MSAGQKRVLAVARNIKELAIKQLYMKVHADLRRGPGKALTIRLTKGWVEVDPRAWKQRLDIKVSSTSDKDLKQDGIQVAAMLQEKLLMSGNPELMRMVTPDKVYALAERTLAVYGYKSASVFLNDPTTLPPLQEPPPQPNPMMIQVETERMRAETDRMDKEEKARAERTKLQIEQLRLRLEDAKITGTLENQAEANDIRRDIAAAQDDRQREVIMNTSQYGPKGAQAIGAVQPNPEISNG